MSNLKGPAPVSWIYFFSFGTALLLYVQSAHSTLRTDPETKTDITVSLPFGARILNGPNKILLNTKNTSSVPSNEDTNRKSMVTLNKGLQSTGIDMSRNSSGGSAIRKNNRVLKKIKSKRRRIRPTSSNRARSELSDRTHLLIIEKNHSTLHFKNANEFSSDMKNRGLLQEGRRNQTMYENNSFVISGNRGNRNKEFRPERQRNSVPETHRDRIGLIEKSPVRATVDTTRNKDVLQEIHRNRVASANISRVNNKGDATISNMDRPKVPQNRFILNARNNVTVPKHSTSWSRDILPEKLINATRSQERNRVIVPSDIISRNKEIRRERLGNKTESNERSITSTVPSDKMSWNKDLPGRGSYERNRGTVPSNNVSLNKNLQLEKQQNRTGLDEMSKIALGNEAMSRNNVYPKVSNVVRPLEKSLVSVPDYTVTTIKYFLQERHGNLAEQRNRNNTTVSEDTMNKNEQLFKVNKNISPFNFPHSLGKIKNKSNLDVHPSKRKLPCPCYWSKEKCGCECTGSLNYDDFQILAGYFQPCQNFSFTLKDGSYFSLPPNLFSRASPIQHIHLKISNSTFDYLFDPTPNTSPFRGVVFEQKGLLQFLNVSVRQGWNWGSLQDLMSSSGAGIDVVLAGCGLSRLSSDFAMVAGGDVKELGVFDSGLEIVGSGAFATFAGLVRFRLPRNRLKSIRRTDLPPEPLELVEIDLSENQLQTLERDLFSEMPSLKTLLLAGNPLRTLHQETLGVFLGKMHVQGIGEFPLQCDCHLRWLKNTTLEHSPVFLENLRGATCRRPPHLRGTPLKDLAEEHLTC